MPRRHDELKRRLVDEWCNRPGVDPPPDIVEETDRGRTVHIYVIWDEWGGLNQEDRSKIIMDAYEEMAGLDKAVEVTVAMGLTRDESEGSGIDAVRQFPTLDTIGSDGFARFVQNEAERRNRKDTNELESLARDLANYARTGSGLPDEEAMSAAERIAEVIEYAPIARAHEDGPGIVLIGATGRAKLKRGDAVTAKELHVLATLSRARRAPIKGNDRGEVVNQDALAYLAERGVRL